MTNLVNGSFFRGAKIIHGPQPPTIREIDDAKPVVTREGAAWVVKFILAHNVAITSAHLGSMNMPPDEEHAIIVAKAALKKALTQLHGMMTR